MADLFARADWALRSEEFGDLEEYRRDDERFVVMEMGSPGISDRALLWRMCRLWSELPRHEHILEAIGPSDRPRLLVRYAALNWKLEPLQIAADPRAEAVVATWGVELVRAFEVITASVAGDDLCWFACPIAKVDLQGAIRVGFVNPAGAEEYLHRLAPEIVEHWPRVDEAGLVFAIGQLLLGLVDVSKDGGTCPLGKLLQRCLSRVPARRPQSLDELRELLVWVGGNRVEVERSDTPEAWREIEAGIGYAAMNMATSALRHFGRALRLDPRSDGALEACDAMIELGADPARASEPTDVPRGRHPGFWRRDGRPQDRGAASNEAPRPFAEIEPAARALEQAGRYHEALRLYYATTKDDATFAETRTAIARCQLELHEYVRADDLAARALAHDPRKAEAHEIRVKSAFGRKETDEVLARCDAWIAALPDDASPHYARAKALLALGRVEDARAACARAVALEPEHLSAMLLGWHIDRSIKRTRATVGHAEPAPLDLPEHLRDLRTLLVAGRNAEALAHLEKPELANDGAAQLLRADLLAFAEQPDAALAVFEHAATLGAQFALAGKLGQATVLVKLGRAGDALALCDALVREHPGAADPYEARAHALQALGRAEEADDAMKRALAADAQRTQMRVRLAST